MKKRHLADHIQEVHEGIKKYKCTACEHSFGRNYTLKKHIEIVHEGKKSHQCTFCDKKFSMPGLLKNHISESHEGNKEYSNCPICNKTVQKIKENAH